jgi:hypothetical protein
MYYDKDNNEYYEDMSELLDGYFKHTLSSGNNKCTSKDCPEYKKCNKINCIYDEDY